MLFAEGVKAAIILMEKKSNINVNNVNDNKIDTRKNDNNDCTNNNNNNDNNNNNNNNNNNIEMSASVSTIDTNIREFSLNLTFYIND